MFAGCTSDSDKYQKISNKIATMDGKTEFSQAEFADMLDYLIANVDGAMATADLNQRMEKYPYFANFMQMIMVADMRHQFDPENQKKFNLFMEKYQPATPFPATFLEDEY